MPDFNGGFAEFEVKDMSFKMHSDTTGKFARMGCVGSAEEEFETKVVSMKCEGKIKKKRTVPTGSGTLKLSLHMSWNAYTTMFPLKRKTLKKGVYAYGSQSHETFAVVCRTLDMDGLEKYKAYPNAVVANGIARKVENGGEEVAEIELEIELSADDDNECVYEALIAELEDETVKEKWMSEWNVGILKAGA